MSKKLSFDEFVARARLKHGDRYDYTNTTYLGFNKSITIRCNIHGDFTQSADSHVNGGHGCPRCAGNAKSSTLAFIEKSSRVHNNKYDYSNVLYKNSHSPVEIKCCNHGSFMQAPTDHLSGKGCSKCAHISIGIQSRKTLEQFILQSSEIHNNRYNYSKSEYHGAYSKIEIICPKHGSFWQNPICHSSGKNCPRCYKNISKIETEWLDSLKVDSKYRQAVLIINGKRYKVDAYDSTTNTIYEFWGDFWHGNPDVFDPIKVNWANKKTFGHLHEMTILKKSAMLNAGYKLIDIWEKDFRKGIKI